MDQQNNTAVFEQEDIEKNKVISALAYLGILFFLPLVVCPNSAYGKFHANQGLVLFLANIIGYIVFMFVPFVGGLLRMVWGLAIFVIMIVWLINTLNGKANELPIIGQIRLIK